jgi:hypothetical protein
VCVCVCVFVIYIPSPSPSLSRETQGVMVRAAAAEQMSSSLVALTVTEGKYHQIKRMVAAVSTARERDECWGARRGRQRETLRVQSCVCKFVYTVYAPISYVLSHDMYRLATDARDCAVCP